MVTVLIIPDQVLNFNIFTSSSLQGLNMTVSVYYSAGPVTLEENGEPLRLIDDNRTLIIPSVQRDDAERRFRVRITNPVSEEIWDCQLNIGDSDLAVLSNITCNISRLGEEMAVNVLLSVEGNATTWEVDGEVPHGYQLKEGNKMIPSVHRNNTKQRLRVGITILVSNETWKYWRENRESYQNGGNEGSTVGIVVGTIVGIGVIALVTVVVIICIKHRNRSRNQIPGWVRACYHRA
ncbi:uncharacterized protein [Aquarana catesbeiana]|uniref:uncharacterized protein n=1 Tax=Aquarana catesbeiana TaxID=8400 RepID=UPI003CC922E5